jgi:hypothetical protein
MAAPQGYALRRDTGMGELVDSLAAFCLDDPAPLDPRPRGHLPPRHAFRRDTGMGELVGSLAALCLDDPVPLDSRPSGHLPPLSVKKEIAGMKEEKAERVAWSAIRQDVQRVDQRQLTETNLALVRAEAERKSAELVRVITRLGSCASHELKSYLPLLKSLSSAVQLHPDLFEDPQAKLSHIRARLSEYSYQIASETDRCTRAAAEAILLDIDQRDIARVFNGASAGSSVNAYAKIRYGLVELISKGRTFRSGIPAPGEDRMLKCRYRDGHVQILVLKGIGGGATKTVVKVEILRGPLGSFGKVFAYAKPWKFIEEGGVEESVASVQGEFALTQALVSRGARHLVTQVPVFKSKSGSHSLKGLEMPWYNLGDARTLISKSCFPLSNAEILNRYMVARQIAQGLEEINRFGWIHCDVKPDNVLLSSTPDGGIKASLGDLGCAMQINEPYYGCVGTKPYFAPEQWGSLKSGWKAAPGIDMWPYGLFLLQLLRGVSEERIRRLLPSDFVNISSEARHQAYLRFREFLSTQLQQDSLVDRLISCLLEEDPKVRLSVSVVVQLFDKIITVHKRL